MQNDEVNSLEEYCQSLSRGRHTDAPKSVERLDNINMRMTELPSRADQYKNTLIDAINTEKDYLNRQKELGNKINEFKFLCKQLGESVTSPLSGLVFSVASAEDALEKHKTQTAQKMEDLEGKFAALQEAESYLKIMKPNVSPSDHGDTAALRSEVDQCGEAVVQRTQELEELLRVEKEKDVLRVEYANIANDIRDYVDTKTTELGMHEGTLETQLSALEALQDNYNSKKPDMEKAIVAAAAQDAAGVVVNSHTPETIETLQAAWGGLERVYAKASEAISAQILAEQTAGLTHEQIAEANDVFDEFDVDKNGDLNLQEFHDSCTSLGLLLDKDEAAVKHAQLDGDGSGRIERAEFLSFYADELTHSDSQEDIVEAFTQLAGNGQYITPQQLSQHFNDAELCEYLLSSMPTADDGSGNLDFTAFTESLYNTSSKDVPPPPQKNGAQKSSLERSGHRRVMSQRAMGLSQTESFLSGTTEEVGETKHSPPVNKRNKKKNRRQSWVRAETEDGEEFFYDDPALGGSGKTSWEAPPNGEGVVREYVERTEVQYNEEWVRHYNDDGSVVYTSNTGKTQTEAPPGFDTLLEESETTNVKAENREVVEDVQEVQEDVVGVQEDTTTAEDTIETAATATATATALYDYTAAGDNQTDLETGEIVVVLEPDAGGWTGVKSRTGAGFVPSTYIELNYSNIQ
jgi:Ca2+-binding EF-hand superfamily protein